MADPDLSDIKRRMDGAIDALHKEFAGLRTGRASAGLVEPIMVEAYGAATPINQVGSISVPEPRMVTVQVWDRSLVGAVEKAIREAGLGLNPASDGQLVRVPIPALSEERRIELTKIGGKYAEQARVAVRNVRRDGMEMLKKMEKDSEISKDEHHGWAEKIQDLTDAHIKKIDEGLAQKEEEILQV
ncbi:ribosome recycling factor [Pelagibius litoralis]|uniref:Ribosome-recycling factor n=1 Tax=Pelagibius litoralis TaxID=374515 RepID=A0A967EUJ7_9PROT|nr:ribosome recycling factor [Pelagibius litoralis]